MSYRLILAAFLVALIVGCNAPTPTGQTGKEVEAIQEAEQKKADEEEMQEAKNRRARRTQKQ